MEFINLTELKDFSPIAKYMEEKITIKVSAIKGIEEVAEGCVLKMCDKKDILVKENKWEIENLIKE